MSAALWQSARRTFGGSDWPLGLLWMAYAFALVWFLLDVPDPAARRLEKGAQAYCEAGDAERAAIERKLAYRLPEGVVVEIRCTKG